MKIAGSNIDSKNTYYFNLSIQSHLYYNALHGSHLVIRQVYQ